ncbi:MAG: hypothetical protein K2Y27_10130 [Xanthobacteraceae bacterium]|nr:hypothetical protein [Xanthobacteraceae bacterium]
MNRAVFRASVASSRAQSDWDLFQIAYIPMARGFVHLAVVLDWFSRRVLSWRLSITMDTASGPSDLHSTARRS